MFSNLQFHVYTIIMQYYNLKKLRFMYTSRGAVHRKCIITNEYEKQWRQGVKASQVISGTIESSERGCDQKRYDGEILKKSRQYRFVIWMVWKIPLLGFKI